MLAVATVAWQPDGLFAVQPAAFPEAGPDAVLDATNGALGVDVSLYDRRVNWAALRAQGIRFAMARATLGLSTVDPFYRRNAARARANGIVFTAYHYAKPHGGAANAIAQADFFVDHISLGPNDIRPVLDLEERGGLKPKALKTWILAFLQRVKTRMGVTPIVYSGVAYWQYYMANSPVVARAGFTTLWIAWWIHRVPTAPGHNWNGNGWKVWQFTGCGHLKGIPICADINRLHRGVTLRSLTIGAEKART